VFVLAWLNIAAQPCLMAMETAPEPAESAAHHAHNSHAAHMPDGAVGGAAVDGCGHCPAGASHDSAPCASGVSAGCENFSAGKTDGRKFELKLKDVAAKVPLPCLADSCALSRPDIRLPLIAAERLKFAGDPPLNLRHCVFLK